MARDEEQQPPRPRGSGSEAAHTVQDESSHLIRPPSNDASMRRNTLLIILWGILLNATSELQDTVFSIPLNQVLEGIICRRAFSDLSDDNDPRCKGQVVQDELSLIQGWRIAFNHIPGMLTAILYCVAAKRYGRRPILFLSAAGDTLSYAFAVLVCSLPKISPRLVWLSAVFYTIGGSVPVFNAMLFAIIGDSVEPDQRSTTFFYLNASTLGSQFVGGFLASALMRVSAWGCMFSAIFLGILPCSALFLLPAHAAGSNRHSADGITECPTGSQTIRGQLKQLNSAVIWFTQQSVLAISLLYILLGTTLVRSAPDLLLQYVTKRYGWSWSDASLLLSIQFLCTFLTLAVVLPAAAQFLVHHRNVPSQNADFTMACVVLFASSMGGFLIGLKKNIIYLTGGLVLYTLSAGYPLLARSILASVIDSSQADVMYTTIGIFESMGTIIAGPLLSASFRKGLDWGNDWLGLPYLVVGALYGSAAIVLFSVRLRRTGSETESE